MSTQKIQEIDPFYTAIVDAIMTLSRTRIAKGGESLVPRPKAALRIVDSELVDVTTARVMIKCTTWRQMYVLLELHDTNPGDDNWLAWGPVEINNEFDSSTRKRIDIKRYIYPSFVRSTVGQPMRLRVRHATAGPR